jgi:hypothetical protein
MQPLGGTFDLVLVQNTPPYIVYAVRDVDFTASSAWAGEVRITGGGTFVRFEEFAVLQDMDPRADQGCLHEPTGIFHERHAGIHGRRFPDQNQSDADERHVVPDFFPEPVRAPVREVGFPPPKR